MCTGTLLKTADGKYVVGRTLEFAIPLIWEQICNDTLQGTTGKFENNLSDSY